MLFFEGRIHIWSETNSLKQEELGEIFCFSDLLKICEIHRTENLHQDRRTDRNLLTTTQLLLSFQR